VFVGNVNPSSTDALYIARHTALKSNVPVPVPALHVNRLCGSGFQSIVNGAQEILTGGATVALCAGTENMTQAPFIVRDVRFGTKLGTEYKFEDSLWSSLTDSYCGCPMAITAENLAEQYGITRAQADEFGLSSHKQWDAANKEGRFKAEIAPVPLDEKNATAAFEVDEHPRPNATLEGLSKLPAVFKKNGTVTAGNASGICDGAGAIILASKEAVAKYNLTPLVRLVAWNYAGVEPKIMGIGPVPAIRGLLKKAGLSLKDIDLVDINEAFASQFLSCQKELELDPAKTNVNGGAIALGHPLGASGSRITAHLTHELRRRKAKYAIGAACIGGGQGIAVLLENVAL